MVALANFDGDGSAEQRLEVTITCANSHCAAAFPPP